MSTTIKTDEQGNKYYYLNYTFHREGGPAIEFTDGEKHWYKNGKIHRENGPAVEYANGIKKWTASSRRRTGS